MYGIFMRYTSYYSLPNADGTPKTLSDDVILVGFARNLLDATLMVEDLNAGGRVDTSDTWGRNELSLAWYAPIVPIANVLWHVRFSRDHETVVSVRPLDVTFESVPHIGRSEGGSYGVTIYARNPTEAIYIARAHVAKFQFSGELHALQGANL